MHSALEDPDARYVLYKGCLLWSCVPTAWKLPPFSTLPFTQLTFYNFRIQLMSLPKSGGFPEGPS